MEQMDMIDEQLAAARKASPGVCVNTLDSYLADKKVRGMLRDPKAVRDFALAGKAFITIVSEKTGARFTFRIRKADKKRPSSPHFVGVLNGPENTSMYAYLGAIFNDTGFKSTDKSKVGPDAASFKAFEYFHRHVIEGGQTPAEAKLSVYHEGRCGCCGRLLTVPESIATGIGPVCASKGV